MNDVINEICLYTFGWEQFPHFQAFLHNLSISWCEHEWYGKTTLCYYDFIKRSRAALFPFTFFDPVSFQTRSANFPLIICSIEFVIENFEHILFSVDKIQLKIIQKRFGFGNLSRIVRLCVVLMVGGKVIVDYRRKLGFA